MKKKKHREQAASGFYLNIIPMIDLFTILNAFLLMSSAFNAFGQIKVEIPFLSSAPPPTEQEAKQKPDVSINVEQLMDKIIVTVQGTKEPGKDDEITIPAKEGKEGQDYKAFHDLLVKLKAKHPKLYKYTLMPDEMVKYADMVKLLDAARKLMPEDPPLELEKKDGTKVPAQYLLENVVIGGVIL